MEFDPAAPTEGKDRRAARPVAAHGGDADRRQSFLQLEAHAGAGELTTSSGLRVIQKLECDFGVEGLCQSPGKPSLALADLGPGRVQQVVRQPMNAGEDACDNAAPVGQKIERSRIPGEKAESVVV